MNNYKLLPALNALLYTKNITEAAKMLNVSQPAMSRTLNQIREAFADPILVKQGKEFYLTKRGHELKLALPYLIEQIDRLYQEPEYQPHRSQRRFQVALDSFISSDSLIQLSRTLSTTAPNTSLSVTKWQETSLVELASSELDLIAVMARHIPDYLHGLHLGTDHYVVLGDADLWPLTRQLNLKTYLKAEHVLVSGLTTETRQVDILFKTHGHQRRIVAALPDFNAAAACLLDTHRIMTVPSHIAMTLQSKFALNALPLPYEQVPHDYYLLWHRKHQQDPEHLWFRNLYSEILKPTYHDDGIATL